MRALAGLDFAAGRQDAAIDALRGLIAAAPDTNATRDLEVTLAGMLDATGQTGESAALLETVIAADHTHVGALKLRARAAIAADRPDAAIQDMRTALTVAPRDPEVMTIMAFAHERAGDRGLMGERLALAVELSNRAPGESLRYANFLMQEDRPGPAEGVVVDALRRDPENRDLLGLLGRIHLSREDWTRAGQVAGLLRAEGAKTGDPVATAMAATLDAARLQGEGKPAESATMLEALASSGAKGTDAGTAAGPADGEALAALVRARLAASEPAEARQAIEAALAADPSSFSARFLLAGLDTIEGRTAEAEPLYRALVAEAPALPEPYLALFRLLAGQGRLDEADAALEAGIAATGTGNGDLVFLRAGLRESQGDLAGAIADYEALYARSSDSPVLANNLASLLTAGLSEVPGNASSGVSGQGSGQEGGANAAALDRAYAIARRLRGTDVPEFQDTYGCDPRAARRRRRRAALSRQGGRGAARQRPGPVPPRRGRARPRQRGGGGRRLCRRPRRRRGGQPPAPGRSRAGPARRDRALPGPAGAEAGPGRSALGRVAAEDGWPGGLSPRG